MQRNGQWIDFIGEFMDLTAGEPSPDLFRRWSAISLVAGALERRVWVMAGRKTAFANLYVLLVGPPGTGKNIISTVRQLWRETPEPGTKVKAFRVAPNNMTKASLLDTLAKAKQVRLRPEGPPLTYHSLLIAAAEFGVLLPDYDRAYIHTLNEIFDNPTVPFEESRRTGAVRDLKIELPQLNIIGGAQPSYLADTFPPEAWSTGLARRLIMVYCPEPPEQELFYDPELSEDLQSHLIHRLSQMSAMYGQMRWRQDAAAHIAAWHGVPGQASPRKDSAPKHSKLVHYNNSRTLLAQKLAIVSAVARTGELVIELDDVKRALNWLLEAERLMPDIFREMIGKSDSQVIEELHYAITAMWSKNKQRPVNTSFMWNFLQQRVPSDKVGRIIETAERANIIARVGGAQDLWVPRPRHEHGVE